jgi:hypothetical protein
MKMNKEHNKAIMLTDKQIRILTTHLICEIPSLDNPRQVNLAITNCLNDLSLIKSDDFEINWNNAPENAVASQIRETWIDSNGHVVQYSILQQRVKQFENGEIWSRSGINVEIIGSNDVVVAYKNKHDDSIETPLITDFVRLFEKMS